MRTPNKDYLRRCLPPLVDDATTNTAIYTFSGMYEPYFKKEWDQWGMSLLAPVSLEPYVIFSARKPLYKIEDFEGISMRAYSMLVAQMLKPVGVLSIPFTYADAYEALQKGILDTAALSWGVPLSMAWYEVAKPGYEIDVGGLSLSMYHIAMNKEKLNSLPPDLREILQELTYYWLGMTNVQRTDAYVPYYKAEYERLGIEIITWSDEEKERLTQEVKLPQWDWWLERMEEKFQMGAEAAEVIARYKDELAKYTPPEVAPRFTEVGDDEEDWKSVVGPQDTVGCLGKCGPGGSLGLGFEFYPGKVFKGFPYD